MYVRKGTVERVGWGIDLRDSGQVVHEAGGECSTSDLGTRHSDPASTAPRNETEIFGNNGGNDHDFFDFLECGFFRAGGMAMAMARTFAQHSWPDWTKHGMA